MARESSASAGVIGAFARSEDRFALLYRNHCDDAMRFAFVLTNDLPMAEDLVQEAFVKVFSRFGERREPLSFGAYLRRTILNLARSQARRRRLEIGYIESTGAQDAVEDASQKDNISDTLWIALQQLPIRQRTVIFFRYHLGMKEDEVADAMGCSLGAVKSMTLRARRTLKAAIEEENHGPDR